MTVVVTSPSSTTNLPDADYADIVLHVSARIMSAVRARRKVNGSLCMEMGDRMLAGKPELVLGEQLHWRVPGHWTSPAQRMLAERVCHLMVDAVTGEVLDQEMTAQAIRRRVEHAARSQRNADK